MVRRQTPLAAMLRTMLAEPLSQYSDRQLVERFAASGDEIAFGEIVKRHGPMLLGFCRRQVGDAHVAEDVLQATFLVLARKAHVIRKRASLAAWLHGVAVRLSRQARIAEAARTRREDLVARHRSQTVPGDGAWDDLLRVLDEEMVRLPQRFRAPLLLCFIEGLTQDEAARQLGWALSTLRRRLERGRDLLRNRMTTRGATLGAGLVAGVLAPSSARAALTRPLRDAILATATGGDGVKISAAVLVLARGGMGMGIFIKVCLWASAAVVFGAALVGAAWHWGPALQAIQIQDSAQPLRLRALDVLRGNQDKKPAPGGVLFEELLPRGAVSRLGSLAFRHGPSNGGSLAFTADGKSLVSAGGGWIRRWDLASGQALLDLGGDSQGGSIVSNVAVSPYGNFGYTFRTVEKRRWSGTAYDLSTGTTRLIALELPPPGQTTPNYSQSLYISRDGALCAALGYKGREFFVWSTASGKLTVNTKAAEGSFTAIAFAPDSKTLLVGDDVHTVRVFNLETGTEQRAFGVANIRGVGVMALSGDGKRVATASPGDDFIRLWNLPLGKEERTVEFPDNGKIGSLAFTSDGQMLVAEMTTLDQEAYTSSLSCWDTTSGKLRWTCKPGLKDHYFLAINADNSLLATMNRDGVIQFWDMASGKEKRALDGSPSSLLALCFHSDGNSIVTVGSDDLLRSWDAATGRLLGTTRPQAQSLNYALPHGGKYVIVDALPKRLPETVTLCNAATGAVVTEVQGSQGALSPDGKLLATSDSSGLVYIYEAATGKLLQRWRPASPPGQDPLSPAMVGGFSADGKSLVLVSDIVSVWTVATGKEKTSWSLARNKAVQEATENNAAPPPKKSGGFSPGGGKGKKASDTSSIRIWPVASVVSPDGSTITMAVRVRTDKSTEPFAGPFRVLTLETASGKLVHRFDPEADGVSFRPTHLAISPDGKRVAFSLGKGIQAWDLGNDKATWKFDGHRGAIAALAFSPDSNRLASASFDTTVLVWDLKN
jgi:RNA polymerase sigma factor (sigma-70 family)